jgi:hypothetical protein
MKIYSIIILMISITAFGDPNPLLGKWETKPSDGGNIRGVIFKDNNIFESYFNSMPHTSGSYTVKGNVISIKDEKCDDITGSYELIFFANSDSLRFNAIEDDCGQRKFAIETTILGRVKK